MVSRKFGGDCRGGGGFLYGGLLRLKEDGLLGVGGRMFCLFFEFGKGSGSILGER